MLAVGEDDEDYYEYDSDDKDGDGDVDYDDAEKYLGDSLKEVTAGSSSHIDLKSDCKLCIKVGNIGEQPYNCLKVKKVLFITSIYTNTDFWI